MKTLCVNLVYLQRLESKSRLKWCAVLEVVCSIGSGVQYWKWCAVLEETVTAM